MRSMNFGSGDSVLKCCKIPLYMYARWRFTSAVDTLDLIRCSACSAGTQGRGCTETKVMVSEAPQKHLSGSSDEGYNT